MHRMKLFTAALLLILTNPVFATNNSLLAISRDGKRLLTANRDNGSVSVVDVAGRKTLREIPVGKQPESVAWIGAGPLAAATAYLDDCVTVFDAETGRVVAKIPTMVEPYGLVVDRAGKRAFVTQEYPGVVTEIGLTDYKILRTIPVGPFLRGVALLPDESRLLTTHYYTAAVSAVDLASGKVVDFWPPVSPSDNLARQIAVHPTLPYAYMAHIRSRTERAQGAGSIFPYLTILDLGPPKEGGRRRRSLAMDQYNATRVTANPWETVLSPDGARNYILFAGTNDMYASKVLNDDYAYLKRISGAIRLGSNPRAAAVSPDGGMLFIYNTLDFTISFLDAESLEKIAEVRVCEPPYSPAILRGKILFNLATQPMSGLRWISCSSCHPDGDHDGRTWQNPEGLRRTTHFFGMSRTYPLHWSADRDELQDFEHTIRGPLMRGRGLIDGPVAEALGTPNAGKSKDLDALAAYCNSLEPPPSPHALRPGKLTAAAERGRSLFFSAAVGCSNCHSGPDYTDCKTHDVGTGSDDPSEKMGAKYDTPTLLRVYRNLSLLHHGKAPGLREVLTHNPGNRHGTTNHLTAAQLDDLVDFLKSLPYESQSAVGRRAASASRESSAR